jgi:hypothetical protein
MLETDLSIRGVGEFGGNERRRLRDLAAF